MTKRMVIMLALVGTLLGAIFGFQAFKGHMIKKFMAAQTAPVQTVSAIKAALQPWQTRIEAVGSLTAREGTDLAPEVSGIVTRIHFKSGQEVRAGKLLLEMNAAADIAQLRALRAAAELARSVYARDQQQFRAHAVSQAVLDGDRANVNSSAAQVAQQQAQIEKKRIRAPFAGRLGIRAVSLGQYLNAGAKIVTLQALDPIYVDFTLPQKSVGQIKLGQTVSARADAFPGKTFAGRIVAIDPKVDPGTRNVLVRAAVRNPRRELLAGMFAITDIEVGAPKGQITLPQTAISYNPYGNLVYLVEDGGKGADGKPRLIVKQRFVTTGDTRGDQVAIVKGLSAGDLVVTSGQIKLRNGSPVVISTAILPANEAAPRPQDQ
ncbi:MAG TPA: efflux RND transporter periplasmic adaptor subunit [Rhodocyclaceae bacterium]|nr:efflux RND transporter periplasmic adaptor subunit [Rhodocyclaceae bacterium]